MVKIGIQLPHEPMNLILSAGVYADRNGFDSVFTPDHLVGIEIRDFSCFEAFTILARLSSETERVLLGTCVSDVVRRHPAQLLQAAVTLDEMSGGRAVLGLGAGEGMNLLPFGMDMRQAVSRLEEGLRVIRLLMVGENVSFTGRFFRLRNATLSPRRRVRLWIAGNSPRTIELTARHGDGWIPTATIGVKGYREALKRIRSLGGKSVTPALFAYTVVAEDGDEARRTIELPGKMIALLSPKRDEFLRKTGVEVDFPDILRFEFTRENVRRALEVAKEIPFDLVEERYIYGSPDEVVEKIERFISAGVEHFVLTPLVSHTAYMDNLKLIAERVIPYVREEHD
ncbi:Coenzyme F420-dependent N5,N10-methylene tetrahydromethanopterin reductase [Geoglobus ahangari]|uniref:Coenzyme F420-dependent N5,N10-methylene tetrahydromethanopterin reductase n=1 Tax=Geoglobus ahangari TaxID=113653 RepID=A0A0F7IEQ5_9EURY|nr:LLM class flavin-dependent oxidoreductase [Geoglobus ahangari]AKG90887.1 Coenzyme F420-dependent N5,N10-methylene tetrahydromethanopterin reductase [Geoglobus ahangari]